MEQKNLVLWVEETEFPAGWGIREHLHEYFHLFYVLSGSGAFLVNRQRYAVAPGSLILVPPNTLHELAKVSGSTLRTYEIKFCPLDPTIGQGLGLIPAASAGSPFIEGLLSYIIENGRSRLPYYVTMVDAYLCTLVGHLSSERSRLKVTRMNSQLIDTTGFSDVTVNIIMYIEQHYMDEISLDILARHVDYNRNYICTLFKKDTGITIIDYLNYVRIRHAVEYISYSEIDMAHVCSRIGFSNVSHFNRTFKKFVGLSPSSYRKMYPLDINSYLSAEDQPAIALQDQLKSVAEAFGTLNMLNRTRA